MRQGKPWEGLGIFKRPHHLVGPGGPRGGQLGGCGVVLIESSGGLVMSGQQHPREVVARVLWRLSGGLNVTCPPSDGTTLRNAAVPALAAPLETRMVLWVWGPTRPASSPGCPLTSLVTSDVPRMLPGTLGEAFAAKAVSLRPVC